MAFYAYGSDTVDGDACPARAAGYEPDNADGSELVAEAYDEAVQELPSVETSEGVVPEKVASDAWRRAIDGLRSRDRLDAAYVGKQIAKELGWL